MIDVEHELRAALRDDASAAPAPHPEAPIRRTRRRQTTVTAAVAGACIVATAVVGMVVRTLPQGGEITPGGDAIPTGRLATIETETPAGVIRLTATGAGDSVCLDVSAPDVHVPPACWNDADLHEVAFEPQYANFGGTGHAIVFGLASARTAAVEFRYAGGGITRAELSSLPGVTPRVRVFLLVAEKAIVRAGLQATDASGRTVGEPYWSVWGAAPGDGISCTCQDWLDKQNAAA
jgi:hypothetical protein